MERQALESAPFRRGRCVLDELTDIIALVTEQAQVFLIFSRLTLLESV